ncbi:DUF4145 domain-containing protein [Dyella flagellata]|uniref:DUF4145 domain-containing protein n=1 Tax=Dyella flagellata TaxID=1867833 RepID=UPI0024E133B0|nr:DUF4145 domain-containing protein [Dyella flagellata]
MTITGERFSANRHTLYLDNADGRRTLATSYAVCPNPNCRKFTLTADLFETEPSSSPHGGEKYLKKLNAWSLVPSAAMKSFPDYVPEAIREDYREACLIKDLSPKASATLSRRCLQGILRDFWKVKPGRLVDEITQIKDKVDSITWDAIEAVRKLGNIGAHMEKDINFIVDVDPNEATLLIGLVETLLKEWYVARADRLARMGAVISAAASKKTP